MELPNPSHPLSMITAAEISATVSLLHEELKKSLFFIYIFLKEPPKSFILSYKKGDYFVRETLSIILDPKENKTYEAVVNITEKKVVSYKNIPNASPSITVDEFFKFEEIVKKDPQVKEACVKKGINIDSIIVEPFSNGYYGVPEEEGKRLIRGIGWMANDPKDNAYAHPIEMRIQVDINEKKVLKVESADHPIPKEEFPYRADQVKLREIPLKPLEIIQKEGPSFYLEDNVLLWQYWNIRFGFNGREGLLLNQVSFYDNYEKKERMLLYRMSLAEMITAYLDGNTIHNAKNPFDEGEYGLGVFANSLTLGCDCLGEIRYVNVWVNNSKGEPLEIPNAICIHEEDYGIGWKHTDWRTNHVEVRRSRRLVISSIYTIGNYEYGLFYYFYLDGTLQVEVKLTGQLNTQALPAGTSSYPYGQRIGPNLVAGHHQHYFTFRIDPCLDGTNNSFVETFSQSAPQDPINNPNGNATIVISKTLKSESEAQRNVDPLVAQSWMIINPSSPNYLGEPVGLKLIPGETTLPFHSSNAPFMERAGYLNKHLWVTPYNEKENYPAGDYPNQRKTEDGLHIWSKQNRNIENTDIVVWYNAGHHHYPRMEDWPIMPVDYVSFWLKPFNFFKMSPAIDVHPSQKKCCKK